jgi:flagellar hook protein FlgE
LENTNTALSTSVANDEVASGIPTLPGGVSNPNAAAGEFLVQFNNDGTPKAISIEPGAGAFPADGTVGNAASVAIGFTTAAITAAFGADRAVDPIELTLTIGNFGTSSGVTQYDAPYQTSLLNQDGNGPTDLERVSFDDKGLLTAIFSDGSSRPIYKLPIATVPAPSELEALSGNAYRITADSGEAVLNFATEGGAGRVSASALENSTVDIAGQFTDLIIAQRAYSAATKIITTGDELLEEITRVKR